MDATALPPPSAGGARDGRSARDDAEPRHPRRRRGRVLLRRDARPGGGAGHRPGHLVGASRPAAPHELVAVEGGTVVGHLQAAPGRLDGRATAVAGVAPVCVARPSQGRGIGSALMARSSARPRIGTGPCWCSWATRPTTGASASSRPARSGSTTRRRGWATRTSRPGGSRGTLVTARGFHLLLGALRREACRFGGTHERRPPVRTASLHCVPVQPAQAGRPLGE